MSSVSELYLRPCKGLRRAVKALAVDGNGVEGDLAYGQGTRPISLCDAGVFAALTAEPGLCTEKFVPNITTEGLCYTELTVEARLVIGGTPVKVTRVGKDCFPACARFAARAACPLQGGCAFVTALDAGVIRCGDRIT